MRAQIAVFGGSFNPPGLHHRQVAEELSKQFDRVIVVPCGPRPDKLTTNDVDPVFRAALADIAFRDLPNVEVDPFDLEQASYTRSDELERRYESLGDVWHVVDSDQTSGGSQQKSEIHRASEAGKELWHALRYAVVARAGYEAKAHDLPPQHRLIKLVNPTDGSSSTIREKIFKREPYLHLVQPSVSAYIERYGLYRGRIPSRATRWAVEEPRLMIVADERNPKAFEWTKQFERYKDSRNPNCILTIGGDGTMLHAIRDHWRQRIPFFGINAGHLGFLLNDPSTILNGQFPPNDVVVRQLPLLYVTIRTLDGAEKTGLAFNDAWVERMTSQSAWLEVKVNGRVRIERLVSDGALVSTAAGSTAYARSMGVAPLLADTPGWLIVGSNVMDPPGWKSALLSSEATVEVTSVGGTKRPIEAFIDGQSYGPALSIFVRMSRIATAELAFCSLQDMAEKIARIQFPTR